MALTPAIFIDKDGTLLENVPYNVEPSRMRLAPGAAQGLRELGRLELPLVVISNQPGVALGHFRYERLRDVSDRLEEMFRANEAHLAACYWCPHHPRGTVASYASACECRKPAPALLQRAAGELGLDLRSSWFIGDILDDVEAGRRAGTRTILIDNGGETEWRQDSPCRIPERVVADLHAAALHIAACAQAELAT